MKTLVIADIHGRSIWKQIVDKHFSEVDKIIFLGDYFDSREKFTSKNIVDNFREIVSFKKENPSKVELLLGNHDIFQYCFGNYSCSGYDDSTYFMLSQGKELEDLIKEGVFKICYQIDNFLFTHAGVTKTFYDNLEHKLETVADTLNSYLEHKPSVFKYSMLDYEGFGNHISQTPIWVRPQALERDKLEGYIHVVGHTYVDEIDSTSYDDIILCDSLGNGNYLIIDNFELLKLKL